MSFNVDYSDIEGYVSILTFLLLLSATVLGSLLIKNYQEQRQCDILEEGHNTVHIEWFYMNTVKKCYIELDNGKWVDADNYRGLA